MKLHRFFVSQLKVGENTINDAELMHQMRNVLHLRNGESIIICDGQGHEARAVVLEYGNDSIKVNTEAIQLNTAESDKKVVLYCAVLKKENFELVCQKATEAGVSEIVPVISSRTIKLNLRDDRLQKIIKEAAEQSGRGIVPLLKPSLEFSEALEDCRRNSINIIFDVSGELFKPPTDSIGIFVGPEGGWDEKELAEAREKGLSVANLGSRILRAETAATIATYLAAI